jgi:hypothetical protein
VHAVEPLELHLPALEEVDPRSGNEVVDDVGDQDFSAEGLAGDARA